jgi:hypothetical protein
LTGNVILTATAAADANDVTFTAVSGNQCEALFIIRDSGVSSTSEMVAMFTGKQIVTCPVATPPTPYTVLPCERLRGGIPNGTVLAFSNGQSVTLNALANAGDRTLTVTSTSNVMVAGSRAVAPITGSGLPVTPNGGNILYTFSASGLFIL